MNVVVHPSVFLRGAVVLPASKSYTIRAYLIAACGGTSKIVNPSDCDDALVARGVAQAFGALIRKSPNGSVTIEANKRRKNVSRLHVRESGTVLRFVLPLLSLRGRPCTVTGEGTLKGRPNSFLISTLRSMGVDMRGSGPRHAIPIKIQGGVMRGGSVAIEGTLSSQFISALMIACPLLREDTELTILGKNIVSQTYVTMTEQVLRKAGIFIRRRGVRRIFMRGNQVFTGLKTYFVPSDYGLTAFPLAAACLIPSDVVLKGDLKDEYLQSDGQILSFLKKMGVCWEKTSTTLSIRGPFSLKGGDFSLRNCPDLVPIMGVLALFARSRTRLLDIQHARVKESDRISDLKNELLKVGARIRDERDKLSIEPRPPQLYRRGCTLNPQGDHRLAMAFCILGLKLGVKVKDIECTKKSYPGFVQDMKILGAKIVPVS